MKHLSKAIVTGLAIAGSIVAAKFGHGGLSVSFCTVAFVGAFATFISGDK